MPPSAYIVITEEGTRFEKHWRIYNEGERAWAVWTEGDYQHKSPMVINNGDGTFQLPFRGNKVVKDHTDGKDFPNVT